MIELGLGKKNLDDDIVNEQKLKIEGNKRNNNCFGGRRKKK